MRREQKIIIGGLLALTAILVPLVHERNASLPLRLRETDVSVIEDVETGRSVEVPTRELLGDPENTLEDYVIFPIPLKELGLEKRDLVRRYQLTGIRDSRKVGTAWIVEVDAAKVPDELNRVRTLDGHVTQDGRRYFYPINGRFYTLQIGRSAYVISKNQAAIFEKLL